MERFGLEKTSDQRILRLREDLLDNHKHVQRIARKDNWDEAILKSETLLNRISAIIFIACAIYFGVTFFSTIAQ